MKKVFQIIAFSISIFLISCSGSSKVTENRNLLKEYAYCKCLNFAIADSSFFKDDLSLSIYREIANYNPEVYDLIDSLAKKAAYEIKPSEISDHNGKKAILIGCFSFYKSQTLDSIIRLMDKKILPGWGK